MPQTPMQFLIRMRCPSVGVLFPFAGTVRAGQTAVHVCRRGVGWPYRLCRNNPPDAGPRSCVMQKFTRSLTREIEVGGERVAVTLDETGMTLRPVGARRPPHTLSWAQVLCA